MMPVEYCLHRLSHKHLKSVADLLVTDLENTAALLEKVYAELELRGLEP